MRWPKWLSENRLLSVVQIGIGLAGTTGIVSIVRVVSSLPWLALASVALFSFAGCVMVAHYLLPTLPSRPGTVTRDHAAARDDPERARGVRVSLQEVRNELDAARVSIDWMSNANRWDMEKDLNTHSWNAHSGRLMEEKGFHHVTPKVREAYKKIDWVNLRAREVEAGSSLERWEDGELQDALERIEVAEEALAAYAEERDL